MQEIKGKMQPKMLDVIVPMYNVSKFISECLSSICEQDNGQFNVIVVNDGSTDNSEELCRIFEKKYDFVYILNKDNGGPSSARKAGFDFSASKYLTFLDGDDFLEPNYIIELFENLKDDVDIVCFNYFRYYDGKKFPVEILGNVKKEFSFAKIEENVLYRKLIGPFTQDELNAVSRIDSIDSACFKAFKRDLLSDDVFIDNKKTGTGEDLLLNLFAFKNAKKIRYIPIPLYNYRKNRRGSITATFPIDFLDKWLVLFEYIYGFTNDINDFVISYNNRKYLSFLSYCLAVFSSNGSFKNKKKIIKNALSSELYANVFNTKLYKRIKMPYRFFFYCCEHKHIFLLSLQCKIAVFLRGRFV